ncbi:neuropeptide FF receptor 2-like [Ptychodera flava]|uniref:neuropeptide FF receptor 2-like n=1 Tax=Ptychodera flava TaxID=63121 RepID=UPI00396AA7F7
MSIPSVNLTYTMKPFYDGDDASPTMATYLSRLVGADSSVPTTSDTSTISFSLMNASFNKSEELLDVSGGLLMTYDMLQRQILQELEAARRRHSQPSVISLMILYTLSFVFGLVGNCLVLFTVAKFHHMRTVTNAFLANLAVCDLLVVLVCMPISLGMEIYVHWIYGPVMCRLVPFIQGVSVSGSMLTLTAVSLNRYYAIRKPLKARAMFTKKSVSLFIAGIWMISIAIMSPILYVNDLEVYEIDGTKLDTLCREVHWPSKQIQQMYGVVVFLLTYFIPLIFTLTVYLRICQRLWNHDKKLRNEPVRKSRPHNSVIENQLKGRRKVVKMLLWLVALFAISWLPYFTTQIYLDFVFDGHALEIHVFFLWLGLSNSSVNPVCYCFMSERFKNCFRMICCCPKFKSPRKFSRQSSRYTGFSRSKSTSFFRSTRTESVRFSAIDTTLQYSVNDRLAVPPTRTLQVNHHALAADKCYVGLASEMSITDLMHRETNCQNLNTCGHPKFLSHGNNNSLNHCNIYKLGFPAKCVTPDLEKRVQCDLSSDSDTDSQEDEKAKPVATPRVVLELAESQTKAVGELVDWESSI